MNSLIKSVLNFFIITYLFIIYFSGVPETNTFNYRLKETATKLSFAVGIWPSWSMFAPNPVKFDSKTFVRLSYKNGDVKEYDVEVEPRGIMAPFRKARWMKYSQDNLRSPQQRGLLDPAIRHFKEKYALSGNPIILVEITRKWQEVHPFSDYAIPAINKTPRYPKFEILVSQQVKD